MTIFINLESETGKNPPFSRPLYWNLWSSGHGKQISPDDAQRKLTLVEKLLNIQMKLKLIEYVGDWQFAKNKRMTSRRDVCWDRLRLSPTIQDECHRSHQSSCYDDPFSTEALSETNFSTASQLVQAILGLSASGFRQGDAAFQRDGPKFPFSHRFSPRCGRQSGDSCSTSLPDVWLSYCELTDTHTQTRLTLFLHVNNTAAVCFKHTSD